MTGTPGAVGLASPTPAATRQPVAVVTGGSRGIGASVAERLAGDGWDVVIACRQNTDTAETAAETMRALGGRVLVTRCDVASASDIEALFRTTDDAFGPARALVNCAGVAIISEAASLDADQVGRMFAVNVLGTMLCCREAIRRMKISRGGNGGAIVNISSIAAVTGGREGLTAYAASKAAVEAFGVGLAKEVAGEGIRVNTVRPGLIATDMSAFARSDPATLEASLASIPLGRFGDPAEIASSVAWLLSGEASFVTGAVLEAAGGGVQQGRARRPE